VTGARTHWIAVLALSLLATAPLQAQTISPGDLGIAEDAIRREEAEQAEQDAARRSARRPAAEAAGASAAPDPFAPAPGGPCFGIRDIVLSGFDTFGEEPEGYRDLVGRCATAADIGAALNRINAHYQETGFITTRAYVPEQDLADGSLEITIVPGRIEGFVYGDGKPADARLHSAFPTGRGALLNLRDLEQGLDNINAPRSVDGRFQLIPGETTGGSFVQVLVEDKRPWHFDLTVDNGGFASTGETKASASLGLDNFLGLNDQLSFGLTSTPFDDRDLRSSDTAYVSWSLPVGNWSFAADLGASRYFFILPGINQSYPIEGRSHYSSLSAERLLLRTQLAKVYAYGDLKLTRTKSFIDSQEIESQRRRLSILSLGLRGERALGQGKFTWDVGAKAGLGAFGSYVLDKSIVDPEFRLIRLNLGLELPVRDTRLTYRGTLVAQHSNDFLPSTEQFSIGGWSTVRGFHDDSMYGDSGIYLSNTLEREAWQGNGAGLTLSGGLDLGYVAPSALRNWSQDWLAGVSVGADLKAGDHATLSLQLAHALSRPDENPPHANPAFEADRTVGRIALKVKY
jgi:hemolysin activation/secretion protein